MKQLRDRVAVVTGGASGIGRGLAERFVAEGMKVVIADIEDGPLQATASEIGVVGIRTDVADQASVQALADQVVERFGAVHVLCNNAGVGGGGRVDDLTYADWAWVLGVNLQGVVNGVQSFLPHLLAAEESHMVNTASVSGLIAAPGVPAQYNASKYAVVAISETIRLELADTSLGVSVLCPGVVNTNIFQSQRNRPAELKNTQRKTKKVTTLREAIAPRVIEPADVAGQVVDAMLADRFWVITHPEFLESIEAKHADLLAQVREAHGL